VFAKSIFWVAVALCSVAQLAILRSVVLGSRDTAAHRRSRELLWVVLPAIALGAVLFFTWRAMQVPIP
jgi:hypothetical protein